MSDNRETTLHKDRRVMNSTSATTMQRQKQARRLLENATFVPRRGLYREGDDLILEALPRTVAKGVCHLEIAFAPTAAVDPDGPGPFVEGLQDLEITLEQHNSGKTVQRRAVVDNGGRAEFQFVLLDETCTIVAEDWPDVLVRVPLGAGSFPYLTVPFTYGARRSQSREDRSEGLSQPNPGEGPRRDTEVYGLLKCETPSRLLALSVASKSEEPLGKSAHEIILTATTAASHPSDPPIFFHENVDEASRRFIGILTRTIAGETNLEVVLPHDSPLSRSLLIATLGAETLQGRFTLPAGEYQHRAVLKFNLRFAEASKCEPMLIFELPPGEGASVPQV